MTTQAAQVLISFVLPPEVSETVEAASAKHKLSPSDYCKCVVVEIANTIAENIAHDAARRQIRNHIE